MYGQSDLNGVESQETFEHREGDKMLKLELKMDMPKGCYKCPFYRGRGVDWKCSAIPGDNPRPQTWETVMRFEKERLENCPLTEDTEKGNQSGESVTPPPLKVGQRVCLRGGRYNVIKRSDNGGSSGTSKYYPGYPPLWGAITAVQSDDCCEVQLDCDSYWTLGNEFMLVASELKNRGMSDEQLARLFTSQFLGKSLKLGNEPDNEISCGDTVYVVATCADTLKRADGSCYFREFGGCPYQESGTLDYCGEREDALAIFVRTL